jgi:pSer/pThr/pTyr-binding forkhead associated (FHA) protein
VHAIVRKQADGYWVSDNQSLNGTEVNGIRIAQPVRLKAGDVIRVASYEMEFQAGETAAASVAATARFGVSAAAPLEAAPAPEPFDFFAAPAPQQQATPAASVACPHCGGQNKTDANFCIHCGMRLG